MLPSAFVTRMKKLLGDEYESFEEALCHGGAVRGLRVNTIKSDAKSVTSELPTSKLPYLENGYILNSDEPVGTHPLHHAGAIYMQDPGAMSTLAALDIGADFKIIDLCAAPGGKSTQAAAALGEGGFLLSNEYVGKRAKLMVGNFERLGLRGAMITSLDTSEFKKHFCEYFDLCIADVPCSGEGMFRKSEDALSMWSEENVAACAKRQAEIIENAAPLIRGGGYLLYSTCTYSLEENEMIIDEFLSSHPEFSLIPVKGELVPVTSDGIVFEGAKSDTLTLCRRFYPHKSPGEGQFIALLQKEKKPQNKTTILYKNSLKPLTKEEAAAVNEFISDALIPGEYKAVKLGDKIVIKTHDTPPMPYGVMLYGVLLGELRGRFLVPSHHFYSAFGKCFKRQLELSERPELLSAYLCGEQIAAPPELGAGFCVMTYRGAVIGGGKCSGGVINNHYPKGLRNKR